MIVYRKKDCMTMQKIDCMTIQKERLYDDVERNIVCLYHMYEHINVFHSILYMLETCFIDSFLCQKIHITNIEVHKNSNIKLGRKFLLLYKEVSTLNTFKVKLRLFLQLQFSDIPGFQFINFLAGCLPLVKHFLFRFAPFSFLYLAQG